MEAHEPLMDYSAHPPSVLAAMIEHTLGRLVEYSAYAAALGIAITSHANENGLEVPDIVTDTAMLPDDLSDPDVVPLSEEQYETAVHSYEQWIEAVQGLARELNFMNAAYADMQDDTGEEVEA